METTYAELVQQLQREQSAALIRIFDSVGNAFSVDLKIPEPYVLDMMNPGVGSRLIAEAALEVIQEDRDRAKNDFMGAGARFAEAAMARREKLEDDLFGGLKGLDVMSRSQIGKESAEYLLKLLQQAQDTNDLELANLAFLGAHISDYPEVREVYFQMVPELEEFYFEWNEIPDDEALNGFADESRFESIAQGEVTLEDIADQARAQYRFLTAG